VAAGLGAGVAAEVELPNALGFAAAVAAPKVPVVAAGVRYAFAASISALVGSLLSIPPTKGIPVGPRAGFGATLVVAGAAAGFGAAAVVVGFVGGVPATGYLTFGIAGFGGGIFDKPELPPALPCLDVPI
jgi:hypothetical protein